MSLDVTTEARDGLTLVTLGGELDIYTVVLDSSGLGALVSLLNRARAGQGQLGLICPHRRLRRVFEITGLRRAFVFGDDLETVAAALERGPDAA
jgi:anti-anti-sigma regulatory factor